MTAGQEIDTHVPDYTQIQDPMEARKVMKGYLEGIMAACEKRGGAYTRQTVDEARAAEKPGKYLLWL